MSHKFVTHILYIYVTYIYNIGILYICMCLPSFVWVKLIVSFTNDGATELNYNSGLYNKQ